LLQFGRLGVYLDFPWNDGSQKFSAPFVGIFNMTSNHTTSLKTGKRLNPNVQAEITHVLNANTFVTSIGGDDFHITRDSPSAHQYTLVPATHSSSSFSLSATFGLSSPNSVPSAADVVKESTGVWENYWSSGGFVDVVTDSTDPRADELQRRVILSRYLMRVNEAGDTPPQEVSSFSDILENRTFTTPP